jgi:hypothetical protein
MAMMGAFLLVLRVDDPTAHVVAREGISSHAGRRTPPELYDHSTATKRQDDDPHAARADDDRSPSLGGEGAQP